MDLELAGKVAVITGGSAGIGRAVARGLAREGVHVTLCARDAERLEGVAADIRDTFGVDVIGLQADVTNPNDLTRITREVEHTFGGTDIVINNAGTGTNETIMEAPDEKWQQYWDLHVMAAVRLARDLVPGMRRRGGGVILNNASICARQPLGHEPIYNVTKAALAMLSKCLANEVAGDNIRVNCVNPGLVQASTLDSYKQPRGKKPPGPPRLMNPPIGRIISPTSHKRRRRSDALPLLRS